MNGIQFLVIQNAK